jgi:molybdopterin synthase sulfur carrier subunit
MSVVRIPPTLRTDTAGEREVIAEGHTVRELLEDLMSRFPALAGKLEYANVYVGGEDIRTRDGYDTPVSPADTVILLPAMAGGSSAHRWGNLPVPPDPPPPVRFADRPLTRPAGGSH